LSTITDTGVPPKNSLPIADKINNIGFPKPKIKRPNQIGLPGPGIQPMPVNERIPVHREEAVSKPRGPEQPPRVYDK